MKRLIILLAISALFHCGCTLQDGDTSGHTPNNMERYARHMFSLNIVNPAATINTLVELEEYINASDEEKMSEAFLWHRQNIFHEDDVTFFIKGMGTVYTGGKSLFDPDESWVLGSGVVMEKTGENTWQMEYLGGCGNLNTTVTYAGQNENGENIFTVEAFNTDKVQSSYPDGDMITAQISTPEGPVTVIQPKTYNGEGDDTPIGKGLFRIDTDRNGKRLDRMELKYNSNGTLLLFSYGNN